MASFEDLPLLPLGNALYPGERIPLHVSEPLFREMIDRCIEDELPLGVVFMRDGKLANIGSTALIKRVLNRYEDGRLDILIRGEERFQVVDLFGNKPYLTASADRVVEPDEELDQTQIERVITQHMRFLELAGYKVRPAAYQGVRYVSFVIGANAGLEPEQKQKLLETLSERERIDYLARHFEDLLPRIERQEDLRRKIMSNGYDKDELQRFTGNE